MINDLWRQGYLTGDQERVFINTSLGCSANCSYCYLPVIGYQTGKKINNNPMETLYK